MTTGKTSNQIESRHPDYDEYRYQIDEIGHNPYTKQFLTIQTKKGNTFYMVIDRSSTSENVYMMSLVDENDLAELLPC